MAIEKGTKKNTVPTPAPTNATNEAPEPVNAPVPDPDPAPASPPSRRGAKTGPRDTPTMRWDDDTKKAILLALRELQTEPVAAVTVDQLVTKLVSREEFQAPATLKGTPTELTLADLLSPVNVRAAVRSLEREYWAKGLDMCAERDSVITRQFDADGVPVKEGGIARELRGKGFPKLVMGRKSDGGLGFDLDEI